MTTLLLGATGRTGTHVLMELLKEGHTVHVIIRDRTKVLPKLDKVVIFEGDITNPNVLHEALLTCEYIVSVLNVSRKSDFPWSKLRTPKTFLSDTMQFVLKAANPNIIKKIIICSAWGTNETKSDIPIWFRWLIENSNIGPAYKDHERQEDLLKESKFNFTVVRPVGLTNSNKNQIILETQNYNPNLKLTISRKSLAKFIVRQISNTLYSRQAVTISKK
jgi:putative NADH-flavin reductase